MFKTFPEFSKLTLADKDEYEALIRDYPPISNVSFAGLMTWWDELDSCRLSLLNNNIVISYWIPGDEENSGLSIIGTHKIQESICVIFDHLLEHNETSRLVHVPEFVLSGIEYPELFQYASEPDFDEYVFSVDRLADLTNMSTYLQAKVSKFLDHYSSRDITLGSINLEIEKNSKKLHAFAQKWNEPGTINYVVKQESTAFERAISQTSLLGLCNFCLYIKGALAGFIMYEEREDDYVIATFTHVADNIPGGYTFMLHLFARMLADKGKKYINFEEDLGIQRLRAEKLALGPISYFRKYTVTPATNNVRPL